MSLFHLVLSTVLVVACPHSNNSSLFVCLGFWVFHDCSIIFGCNQSDALKMRFVNSTTPESKNSQTNLQHTGAFQLQWKHLYRKDFPNVSQLGKSLRTFYIIIFKIDIQSDKLTGPTSGSQIYSTREVFYILHSF